MDNKKRNKQLQELLNRIPLTWENGHIISKLDKAIKSGNDFTKDIAINEAKKFLEKYE